MPIVAADLEGTLTTGETWRGLGRYLAGRGRAVGYRAFLLPRLPLVLLARLGLIDQQAFRDRWVRDFARLLAGFDTAEMEQAAEWVVEHELWPKRREAPIEELRVLASNGYRVVLASGTYLPALQAFAGRLGAEAIGTPLEVRAGRLTGRLVGQVNTGEVKAARVRLFAGPDRIAAAYGDTVADLPMLELAERPTAIRPDAGLTAVAKARNWRIDLAG